MKLIRALAPALLAPMFLLTAATVQAADASDAASRGEDLAWQYRCMTCHGATGISTDERYPYLAGQKAAYIVDRLKYFKSEQEPFNQMNGQARQLSDEDMQDLAAYFSAQRR
ncbi:MAG TPA: c-type cytochrome [Pseudomonadales bacterium]|nr:c-type cytochrome [Pseudomonadales bacterium]